MEKTHNLRPLVCPNCSAQIELEDGLSTYVCPYCEAKILVEGQSDGELQAKVDMAELDYKKYELKHKAIEREKEYNRKRREEIENNKIGLFIFLFLLLFGIGGIWLGAIYEDEVSVPLDSKQLLQMNHSDVFDVLKKAGFKKIKEIQIEGKPPLFSKSDVATISIDGKQSFRSGKRFLKRAPVIITFYSDGD